MKGSFLTLVLRGKYNPKKIASLEVFAVRPPNSTAYKGPFTPDAVRRHACETHEQP